MTERTTILIVDDESKIRRLLSRSLETEGFDVAVADSAMSASEFLKNGHCDLIILDYMMPEIDGMAFLAELRKKSSIPVIMLSAREEIAKKTQALELGADDYVVKPFSPRELVARVRAVLNRTMPRRGLLRHHDLRGPDHRHRQPTPCGWPGRMWP